ncbi:hypothetical protein J2TS6_28710 [Paenibacillus albilobatus]|uniref:Nucleotidyltransferase family protein n=2 Tax=Paenibacillus TaxID=44249 RepID=A0A919XJP4_9BACL|nr:hypothetical protein [Paenibacillus albilobatus]GIO31730.1 hypothetical protein J2TS6_28710 [Paenibacillus albilobatus]
MDVLERAEFKRNTAHRIMADLNLPDLWKTVGDPILVGAVAYHLVVNPDIDMEIYCDEPNVESGFEVLKNLAIHPNVTKARFSNHLDGPDQGLYFQIRYKNDDGEVWKLDMWLLAHDHPGPCARDLVEPLKNALDDAKRKTILTFKEEAIKNGIKIPSIQIYEAVMDHNIQNFNELMRWHEKQPQGLTTWKPKSP